MPRRMSAEKLATIEDMIGKGMRDMEISRGVKIDAATIAKVRAGRHSLQGERRMGGSRNDRDPSPEEIIEECRKIRLERIERGDYHEEPLAWRPPVVSFSEFDLQRQDAA